MLLVGGVAAGCSSDVSRFQGSILTGSARHQAPAVTPAAQPYPGDQAGIDRTPTGSVNRGAVRTMNVMNRNPGVPVPTADVGGMAPVQVASAAPVTYDYRPVQQQTQAMQPVAQQPVSRGTGLAPVAAGVDTTVTGTVAQPAPAMQAPAPVVAAVPQPAQTAPAPGWNASSAQVTVRPGDTVSSLSRRYGVPAEAIQRANNISNPNSLSVGQQIVIPAYTHGSRVPVSAPDASPRVAAVQPGTPATSGGTAPDRAPIPGPAPQDRVAVLPQQPKPREQGQAAATATPEPAAPNANVAAAQVPQPSVATRPASATTAAAGPTYTVVAGDTLNGIARKTGTSSEALKQANGLSSGLIRIGQQLVIPAGGTAGTQVAAARPANVDPIVTGGATRPAAQAPKQEESQVAAYQPPVRADAMIEEASRQTTAATPSSTGIERMRWPVRGRVVAPFGATVSGKPNDGIDIAVPQGTPVKAAENGVVIFAGPGLKDFGNTVLVRHDNGLVTVYGHASEIKVSRGDKVTRGQDIALSGMTGAADTPKLHFEVRKNSAPVDPSSYLE